MNQKSLYELQSDIDASAGIIPSALKGRNEFIIEYINSAILNSGESPHQIAELSIGDGRLSLALLESISQLELTCLDISSSRLDLVKAMLSHASDLFSARTRFMECNFDTQFDLMPDATFDVVIALDIMEHVFDVFNFMEHCSRVLKQQGFFILRVPNVAYIRHRLSLLFGKLPVTASWFGPLGDLTSWKERWGWDGGHLHLFTIPILFGLLRHYGFSVQLIRDPGTRFETLRNLWPTLLYSNPVIIALKGERTYEK